MNDLEFVGDYRNPQQLTARQRELGFDGSSAGAFSFDDFLDIINPLQHIPVVSTLYRAITGDEISPHARIFGDTLFGGPTGFLSAAATSLFEEIAGEDIGETVLAFFTGESRGDDPQFAEGASPTAAAPNGTALTGTALTGTALTGTALTGTTEGEPPAVLPGGVLPPARKVAAAGAPLITGAGPGAPPEPGGPGVLPTAGGPGMLTGREALSALFDDLTRDAGPAPLPGRADEARMKSYPLPPRPAHPPPPDPAGPAADSSAADHTEATALHPLVFAQNAAGADLADRMMQALDKYGAMTRQRHADRAGSEDETRWHSDPALRSGGS